MSFCANPMYTLLSFDTSSVLLVTNCLVCCMYSFSGDGVLICSIDNMPAQLPREATEYFGSLLMPHVHDIVRI